MKQHRPTQITAPDQCDGCGTQVHIARFSDGGRQVAVEHRGATSAGDPIYMTHRHND